MMVPGAPLPGEKQMELLPSLRTFLVRRSNSGWGMADQDEPIW